MKIPKKPKTPSPLAITPKVPFAFSNPGKRMKCWPTAPIDAIIATRPCLISADRSFLKPASSPTVQKPRGSKKPKGGTAPGCSAGLKGGGAATSASFDATATSAAAGATVSAAREARPRPMGCREAVLPAKPTLHLNALFWHLGIADNPNCSIASLPVANSAAKMPKTLIMAMRPLPSSLFRISSSNIFTPRGSP